MDDVWWHKIKNEKKNRKFEQNKIEGTMNNRLRCRCHFDRQSKSHFAVAVYLNRSPFRERDKKNVNINWACLKFRNSPGLQHVDLIEFGIRNKISGLF